MVQHVRAGLPARSETSIRCAMLGLSTALSLGDGDQTSLLISPVLNPVKVYLFLLFVFSLLHFSLSDISMRYTCCWLLLDCLYRGIF